ncbi:hypothetical protein [Bacillus sp. FJAT-44742]|uniref:hypothetical protein n=1 Tax=Bacillus sp. FJAT-44742 TaxID=2014005 RepID=UPI0012FE9E93|nr:hypothetical protein [Bacillus sp. FJAT-44742]
MSGSGGLRPSIVKNMGIVMNDPTPAVKHTNKRAGVNPSSSLNEESRLLRQPPLLL